MKNDYTWKATLKSGEIINQYDKNNKEIPFSVIEENMENLKTFEIGKETNVLVDLETGKIYCNGDFRYSIKPNDVKLVYYRRNKILVNVATGKQKEKQVTHRIGLKNKFETRIVEITPNNQILLHDW